MNTNTKTIVALAAVVAISAVLVGSVLAQDAMACRHSRHNGGGSGGSSHQTVAQGAVSGNGGQSQNIASLQNGHDNASVNIGVQNRD
jgi:hypothetical protein